MSIDWNWGTFLRQASLSNIAYLDWFWSGLQVAVALSIAVWIIAFFTGSLFDTLRAVPNRFLSGIGTLHVELFRNVPLTVQFSTWRLVTPGLSPENIGMWFKVELDLSIQFFLSLMLCLGLFIAVRVCEQAHATTQSLPHRQKNAALATGLMLPQACRYVLLLNAHRVIVPPITSEMMNLVKNFAIASVIDLVDAAARVGRLLDYSAHVRESSTTITLACILINVTIMLVMNLVGREIHLPGNLEDK